MRKMFYITLSLSRIIGFCAVIVLCISLLLGYDIFKSYISTFAEFENSPLIVIDAGHGGEDGGTVSEKGYVEKDINLSISKKLSAFFTLCGYETIMIRDEDKMIYDSGSSTIRSKKSSDLHNRTNIVNSYTNCLLLSIHQNHYTESKYSGAQVFYSPNNESSVELAQLIQNSIVSTLQKSNTRQIKKSGSEIYLLYHSLAPAVMVECGFLSNTNEAELLISEQYQKKMSLAILKGTMEFINNKV